MAISASQILSKHASCTTSRPHPRTQPKQTPARLRQIQYRSYQLDIQIYHFRADYIPVPAFRNLLNRHRDGYIDTLIHIDTLSPEQFVPAGDELPVGCIEAAYLPGVFPRHNNSGSALGFRVGGNVIQWFCFERPIQTSLLESWVWDTKACVVRTLESKCEDKLFDFVARVDKGLKQRRVKGANREHKLWHDSLWGARARMVRVRLTWRNYGVEKREWRDGIRAEAQRREMVQKDEGDGEVEEFERKRVDDHRAYERGESEDKDTEDEMGSESN
jgi:hypothetical protein